MRAAATAAIISAVGGLLDYRVGTPQVRAYPAPDGTMVVKLTLSRAPGFVAYLRAPGGRMLGAGGRTES